MSTKQRRRLKAPFSYVFLAPEGTMNSWELRFDAIQDGPKVVRGQTKYFEEYLPLVRLARKYLVRYVLCTVALKELEKMPRSLCPYVIPGPMPFTSPDIFGVHAFRHENLEDAVTHYARSRHLDKWLLVDSTYERRSTTAHDYTSLPCDPVEGLQNAVLVASITQWLENSLKAS